MNEQTQDIGNEVEEITETTEVEVAEEITTKEVKRKPRAVEELTEVAVKSMTEQEMRKYIEFLRNELNTVGSVLELTRRNAESAYKKIVMVEEQANTYRVNAQQKLLYIKTAIANLNKSIELIGIKEDN